jgi:hypothetical protein
MNKAFFSEKLRRWGWGGINEILSSLGRTVQYILYKNYKFTE